MTLINSSISATPCCSLLLWKLNKTTQAPGKGVRLLELQQEGLRLGQQWRFSEGEGVGEGQGDGAGPPNLRKVPSHPMRMRAQLHIHSTHRLASVSSRRTVPALLGVPDSCPVTPPASAHHQPASLAISGSPPRIWGTDPPHISSALSKPHFPGQLNETGARGGGE